MTRQDMEHQAVLAALAFGSHHSYVNPGFTPHEWVLTAMETVYKYGVDDGREEATTGMGDG